MTHLDPQPWMTAPDTVHVMAALGAARFVGGAVRNALLGRPVSDVDIATPLVPQAVCEKLAAAAIKVVPTGIAHGTVTAVAGGTAFEVTTLRRDVHTDGRWAEVEFTQEWSEDAQRRDFTMNAVYADAGGEVFDFVGGVEDIKAGRLRFVGDPVQRIREDYLRILRLFRFHAWYGKGEIDAAALEAAAREKSGIGRLSGERIAKAMLKLLESDHPQTVMAAMVDAGILAEIFPGPTDIDCLAAMAATDAAEGFVPDGLLRLASLIPEGDGAALASRWKLSNAQRDRLLALTGPWPRPAPYLPPRDLRALIYVMGAARFEDDVRLTWARDPIYAEQWRSALHEAAAWQPPQFPLSGEDVLAAGVSAGPEVGKLLAEVEDWWIGAGFPADRQAVLERLRQAVAASP